MEQRVCGVLPLEISIHALREEGHTRVLVGAPKKVAISIHALREEGDVPCTTNHRSLCVISIHALREEGDVVRDGPMLFCC